MVGLYESRAVANDTWTIVNGMTSYVYEQVSILLVRVPRHAETCHPESTIASHNDSPSGLRQKRLYNKPSGEWTVVCHFLCPTRQFEQSTL
jgi:hypothetical protein